MNWIFVPFDDRSFSGWSCLAIYPGARTWSNSPCGLWSVFISNGDKDVFKRDPFSIDCQGNVNRTPRVRMQITDKVRSWVEFITSAFDGFYICTWTPSSLCILSSLLPCEHHTSFINTKTDIFHTEYFLEPFRNCTQFHPARKTLWFWFRGSAVWNRVKGHNHVKNKLNTNVHTNIFNK